MVGAQREDVLEWARLGEGYSLTRIYLRVRKVLQINRTDPDYRRLRPCLFIDRWPGLRLVGKHVVGDRRRAEEFFDLLKARVSLYRENNSIQLEPAFHRAEDLGIIFLQLHEQEYGTQSWTYESLVATCHLMQSHLQGSWLPGDLQAYPNPAGFPQQRWVARLLDLLLNQSGITPAGAEEERQRRAEKEVGDRESLGGLPY